MHASRTASRLGLRFFALGYLSLLLLIPIAMIFFRAFEDGAGCQNLFGEVWGCVCERGSVQRMHRCRYWPWHRL